VKRIELRNASIASKIPLGNQSQTTSRPQPEPEVPSEVRSFKGVQIVFKAHTRVNMKKLIVNPYN